MPLNRRWHDSLRRQRADEEHSWAVAREAWAVEAQEHETKRVAMEEERQKWARERREKEDKERRDQDEEAKKRADIAWVGLEAGHCLRYRVKEYKATLSHVPLGVDGLQECWNKSIEMHGKKWPPSQCEDEGLCGRVTGHWQIDINEPSCTPWWSYPINRGCAESGYRRYDARLENFPDTTDWPVICNSAPANISGTWYDRPTSCEHLQRDGIWGKWLINDSNCR
ncbi:hypothetical protein GALMADRAFT_1230537 [Galerina marginata CBS 339.88]|uniref:Uncharacterized protein n=1 Tax=Galerina marginata (strain CBS 339.88) TaxID=685588 RepID=A0A067T7S0_GALM3|nr:hypothetical protein GALMADRAFT_1230537 [Galerina marginata CBS 339.88]